MGMKYCDKCNKTISDDFKHCPECGKKLSHIVKETVKKELDKKYAGKVIEFDLFAKKTIFSIIIVAAAIIVLGFVIANPTGFIPLVNPNTITTITQKQSCPFECCVNDPNYETRVCQGNYQCINNKCVKINCPYECCPEGEYSAKSCQQYYECQNNKCVAIDSDKDGLPDYEEIQLGTNPNLADSDSDGLNDYQEVKIYHTDPLKANTDCDRYNDGDEVRLGLNALIPNSANIVITKLNEKNEYNAANIIKDGIAIGGLSSLGAACTGITLGACAAVAVPAVAVVINAVKDDVLYTVSFDAMINNQGTDYSQHLKYDVIFSTPDGQLISHPISLGRVDTGQSLIQPYKYEITAKDIPVSLWRYITGNGAITTSIENIDFEKFSGC